MVQCRPLLRVCAGSLFVLRLRGHRRDMSFASHRLLLRRGTGTDSSVSTVVADAVDRSVVDDRGVIDVVNVGDIHIVHRAVVVELSALPASALVAVTVISIAVTDSAIEADLLAPISVVENKSVAAPTPVRWSPEQTGFRCHDPRAWHPVITVVVTGIGPIPGCPKITIAGTKGLLVDRQFRWGE